ncbi:MULTISPECIES: hypothetical protein [unclassified Microbacterium]|uniref:hypothetical protein n=1 Tax=unclassified Microbacterium TaxID=2609290 RepID=UPI00109C82ED|nr:MULTISPECIES: hypothetical protein [unclassified Microbacterium]
MASNLPDTTDSTSGDARLPEPEVADLYIRGNGDALLIIDIDAYEATAEDFARLHPQALNVSQRDGFSVVLCGVNYSYGVEVFEGGVRTHKLMKSFRQDFEFRLGLWLSGDVDPWREWEVGNEPVAPLAPSLEWPDCGCTKCDAHADDVEF